MTNQHSNTAQQLPTHKERFAEACKAADFASDIRMVGGYLVWDVQYVQEGQKVVIDGPYFTEDEARISADLLRGTFRGARAYQATHCWAWNPDFGREKAIRDDAMASRMMLAMQIGVEVPTHNTANR